MDKATGERSLLAGHACWDIPSLVPGRKVLCANTCEGTRQVRLIVLKNITLPHALPHTHIGALKIAGAEQLLTAVRDEILCVGVYIVSHTHTQAINSHKQKLGCATCKPGQETAKRSVYAAQKGLGARTEK